MVWALYWPMGATLDCLVIGRRGVDSRLVVVGDKALRLREGIAMVPTKCRLTPRWSGRVRDKVPSSNSGARAAQLNR